MENDRSGYNNRTVIIILTLILFPVYLSSAEVEEYFNLYNEIMSWTKHPRFDGYATSNVFYLSGSSSKIKNKLKVKSTPIIFYNTSEMIKIGIDSKTDGKNISINIFDLQGKKYEIEKTLLNGQPNTPLVFCFYKKEFIPGIYLISVIHANLRIYAKKFIVLK